MKCAVALIEIRRSHKRPISLACTEEFCFSATRSERFSVVVVNGVLCAEHLADPALAALASDDKDLLRIGVLTGVNFRKCREREVTHPCLAGVDDLVSDLWPSRRACDHIVFADRISLVTEAQLAFPLDDRKHLLFAVVAVERTLNLAGRQHRKVVAELLGSDMPTDLAAA